MKSIGKLMFLLCILTIVCHFNYRFAFALTKSDIIGKWQIVKVVKPGGNIVRSFKNMVLFINGNGTVKVLHDGNQKVHDGVWRLDVKKDEFCMGSSNSSATCFKVEILSNGEELILHHPNNNYTYHKRLK